MAESRKLEEMLRHLDTEYTDTAAAKLRLGLDPNAARLPRMPRSVNLKPWQFSGIDAVDVIAAKFDGVLLADAMGLGKTPIYIANLLLVSSDISLPQIVTY
jgi:SNF2 family DNA or RNA helicase